MLFKGWRRGVGGLLVAFAFQAGAAAAAAPDSARLGRAKDYIADEQWTRAIAELRTVVADPKDKSRDEALYWLAHSLNQAGDSAAAITTIRRLEREYPTSLWVKPAGSLRVDIAVHLQRSDVLWWMAVPPAPPAPVRPRHRARRRYHPRLRRRLSWRRRPLPPCRRRLRRPAIVLCRRLRRRMSHRRSRHRQCLPPPGCPRSTALTPTSASRRWTG